MHVPGGGWPPSLSGKGLQLGACDLGEERREGGREGGRKRETELTIE